jgi:hypothetical protein
MTGFQHIRADRRLQLVLGLVSGIIFGFLLQKGGATEYPVIIGQLLLTDFTVLKVMLSAVLVGMIGVYTLRRAGVVSLHCKEGSVGSTVIGGLIFGAGFAILGYCPGTAAGAAGSGSLDAAMGMAGMVLGAGIFARLYPVLDRLVLRRGILPQEAIPDLLGIRPVFVIVPVTLLILGFFLLLSWWGL